jgi:hypothetical protein
MPKKMASVQILESTKKKLDKIVKATGVNRYTLFDRAMDALIKTQTKGDENATTIGA